MEPQVSDDRQPTRFGWWLLQQMASLTPPLGQSDLARATHGQISQATISRWIYSPGKPNPDKVILLAPILGVDTGEILYHAGHAQPARATTDRPATDPLMAKLAILIGDHSPVPATRLNKLRATLELVIEPYEEYLTRRRVG